MRHSWMRFAAATLIAAAVGACAPADPNAPRKLTDDVSVSGQITAANVKPLADKGFHAIVNMRPDDESPDQSKYVQIQSAAQAAGLGYSYMPVKNTGAISKVSVKSLASNLAIMPKPVLVYAETRKRAAEVWALVEASRPNGLDGAAIRQALKSAEVPAEPIAAQIDARIAARPKG